MIDPGMRGLRAMAESAKAIEAYKTSELSKHMDELLSNLAESYRLDLADVAEENLRTLQAKLKQTLAIRAVIRGESGLPRV